MFSVFGNKNRASGQTGIYLSEEGVAAAHVVAATTHSRPRLAHCDYESGTDEGSLVSVVKRFSKRKSPTVSVLRPADYYLVLVEAPDVPEEELRAAVRWRIKDLIDFHIDDAVIDVFQMPAQGRGVPNPMMYAIAAKAESVKQQVQVVESLGLKLEVIDIPELCLRNVASMLEEDDKGVALLHLDKGAGTLLLLRQGVMYLTRRIETGVEALGMTAGLRSELIAGLALEARRSLDYFESHYEQTPIGVLYTSGLTPSDHDQLTEDLGISVRNLSLDSFLEFDIDLSDEMQRLCLPAIGAALRKESVTL